MFFDVLSLSFCAILSGFNSLRIGRALVRLE